MGTSESDKCRCGVRKKRKRIYNILASHVLVVSLITLVYPDNQPNPPIWPRPESYTVEINKSTMSDQIKYTQKLKDAHVLIIGGSAGIGYGVAEAVLENGGRVTISSSNSSRVQNAVERLQKAYPSAAQRVAGHACGLGDEATLESNVKSLFEKTGELDHVVFTAGDALATIPIQDVTMDKVKKAGMVRFFAPLMIGKIAPQYLKKSPASSITLTTGAVSERPIPDWSVVGSYAAGLQAMTRGLALDLKPIRVNLVSPGAVDTVCHVRRCCWLQAG